MAEQKHHNQSSAALSRRMPSHLWLMAAIFVGSAYLGLMGLDNTCFWDDEAAVGIHAKNILTTGKLTSWDGRNLWAFRNGSVLDANLRPRDTTLHYFITAASFRLFGISTWAGRFPSVVAGLLALAVFGFLLLRNPKVSKLHAVYSFGLLGLSVVFLLNIRQCRYYALALLLCLLVFAIYQRCLVRRGIADFLLLGVLAVGTFYIHLTVGASFLLAVAGMHLICHRREFRRAEWGKAAAAVALFALATVPYALADKIWVRPERVTAPPREAPLWMTEKLTLVWWNLRELNAFGYIPWTIAAGSFWLLYRRRKGGETRSVVLPWLVLCVGFVVFISLLSQQPTRATLGADARYLFPLLPFLAGLAGWLLAAVHQWRPAIAAGLFAATILTNVLSLTPLTPKPRWLLPAYVKEVHHEYPTCYSAAVAMLRQTAGKDDLVFAFPEHYNYPLMFYLGDQVRICCLLEGGTGLSSELVHSLKAPLFLEENFPDWFVVFGASAPVAQYLNFFSRPHLAEGGTNQFRYTLATNLNVYWLDTHRPELPWHSFGPERNFDPRSDSVFVFKRTSGSPGH